MNSPRYLEVAISADQLNDAIRYKLLQTGHIREEDAMDFVSLSPSQEPRKFMLKILLNAEGEVN